MRQTIEALPSLTAQLAPLSEGLPLTQTDPATLPRRIACRVFVPMLKPEVRPALKPKAA